MLDIVCQLASQLNIDEMRELANRLKGLLAALLNPLETKPSTCPRCGCTQAIRYGKTTKGTQRWLCKGCGRSFTPKTYALLATSKLEEWQWMAFAECMADMVPLRECARRCETSLPTAWFMRMRICEVLESVLPQFRGEILCQIDGTYFSENLSGNCNLSCEFDMPRDAHKSGKGVRRKGRNEQKICLLTGINEQGDVFAFPISRGVPNAEVTACAMEGLIGPQSIVETDGHHVLRCAVKSLGVVDHRIYSLNAGASHKSLAMVNGLHSRLDEFIDHFHGVATRRLSRYLSWFCWREMMRVPGSNQNEAIYRHLACGFYKTNRRELFKEPRLFMEYWENAA